MPNDYTGPSPVDPRTPIHLEILRRPASAWLRINRPRAGNALSPYLISALDGALTGPNTRLETGAVCITGAGGVFCAGADVAVAKTILSDGHRDKFEIKRLLTHHHVARASTRRREAMPCCAKPRLRNLPMDWPPLRRGARHSSPAQTPPGLDSP